MLKLTKYRVLSKLLNFDVFISFCRLPKRKRLEVPNGIVTTSFINSQLHVLLCKIYLYEINNGKVQQTFPFIVCWEGNV